jgi:hypothetical protein
MYGENPAFCCVFSGRDKKRGWPERLVAGGAVIETTDEMGNPIDTRPLLRLINLRAVQPDGRVVRRDSVQFPENGILEVDLNFD